MAQNTPVLVNGASTVLVDHVNASGAGYVYNDYESFAHALNELASNEELRTKLGNLGRDYVTSRYRTRTVRDALIAAVKSCQSFES
jgi:glycosyltransferase involved in cell wall biosynthesis